MCAEKPMALVIKNLSFAYKNHKVLHDISFTADPGEIITIIGPNGSGKTTCIKCIAGLAKPASGVIELNSQNIYSISDNARARAIAYVPQRSEVSGISVFDLILLGRRPYISWDIPEADLVLAGRVIEYMGLKELAFRQTDAISGGEFQIAQIARAIIQEPALIALDEPTSNLDIQNQRSVMLKIKALVQSKKLIAVITNHDINLSIRYSDKFVLLKDGRIYASGSHKIITSANIKAVYGIDVHVETINGFPVIVPREEETKL